MKPLTGLCGSYVKLWQVKQEGRRRGVSAMELEYTGPVVAAKKTFHEWFFKAHELGLDPTVVCTKLIPSLLA
jgi:hypothetical protein